MTPQQVLHVVRAAAAISGQARWVVVGSQALALWTAQAPGVLLRSMEVDLYPEAEPRLAELVDGAIGEGSTFHETFGYYAHGVGPDTAMFPSGWEARARQVQEPTTQAIVVVPSPSDLAAAKLAAFRPKDLAWVGALLDAGLVTVDELRSRVEALAAAPEVVRQAARWLEGRSDRG